MARFNKTSPGTKTVNLAGGEAYSQSPELELISILLTSFAQDQFYRSANDTFDRLKQLIESCDKKFVAKAAIYARTKFGMRSITHVLASELAKHIKENTWAKSFYEAVVYRPDDMMEILSYHKQTNGKVPNSMKKGFAAAFDKFDRYQLAKYRHADKAFMLIDVVKIVHPVPSEKNAEAIAALIKGDLKSFDTWESELTKAGQAASTEEEKIELKGAAWAKLIESKKIGYFALLRNLRNIIEQSPASVPGALAMLIDEKLIRKSLVLPFRFITAYDEIQKMSGNKVIRDAMSAINTAMELSLKNVPVFEGETLVVLDVSSSMTSNVNRTTGVVPAKIGGLFAAVLMKANNCDFMTFDGSARYVNLNTSDTVSTLAASISYSGGSTNFHAFDTMKLFEQDKKALITEINKIEL